MARNTRYFGGFKTKPDPNAKEYVLIDGVPTLVLSKHVPKTGTRVWDKKLGAMVYVSGMIPRVASKTLLGGEPVICRAGGETLDFGDGPVHVSDAAEKRRYMAAKGVMPAPENWKGNPKNRGTKKAKTSFAEHFHKENGISLHDYVETKHGKIPDGCTVNLEFD